MSEGYPSEFYRQHRANQSFLQVLCVGGQDFTLFGRPLLRKDLVNVEATVVEKTLSHCRIYFYNRRRKNSRKTKCK